MRNGWRLGVTTFVDTNILLYSISVVPDEQAKRDVALRLIDDVPCAFSIQVFNEFLWRATSRRNPSAISLASARRFIDTWRRFPVQPIDIVAFDGAWEISALTNYAWWDCLILSAARTLGCDTLLSEDMQHGHIVDGVRIENPFRDLA